MLQNLFHKNALARLAAFCLGTSALTLPAFAASFSVGGGTITTTQADNSVDNTGSGGAFELQANTVSSGDVITVSNVNTTALDVGNLLPSTGSYAVTMQGSTLSSYTFFRSLSGGPISFDSTGGAANTLSGSVALNVGVNSGSGGVSIKTGADIINGAGCCVGGIAISAVGSGTVSIDTVGATITSAGLYGVVAQSGNADVTIGGLNGGMASSITATNGYGIYTTGGNVSVTIAPSGSITALDGIFYGGVARIDNFGTIAATNNAVVASASGQLNLILEAGSITSGRLLGSNSGSGDTFTIFGGANINGATFDGSGGTDSLNLTGSGNDTFAVASASNIEAFQKSGTGTWTLTGTTTNLTPWTISGGTLAIANDAALGATAGTLTVDGGTLQVTAATISNRTVTLNSGGATFNVVGGAVLTENGVIGGPGTLTVNSVGTGTVVLSAANTYTGGTVINNGTLQLGTPTTAGSLLGNVLNNAKLQFDRSDIYTFGGDISGPGIVWLAGQGTVILTGTNNYTGDTTVFINSNLQAGNGGATGSLANGAIHVGGGVVTFDRSNSYTFSGSITDAVDGSGLLGRVAVIGSGTTVFTGANTYTGGTTISSGILAVSADSSLGAVNSGITLNGGTFRFLNSFNMNGGRTIVLNAAGGTIDTNGFSTSIGDNINNTGSITISGSGSLTKKGDGLLLLTGTQTYTGGTILDGGNIQVVAGSLASTGGVTINGGLFDFVASNSTTTQVIGTLSGAGGKLALSSVALTTNSQGNSTFAGDINGNGSLIKAGTGTLILTGLNNYSGQTVINAGTLKIVGGGSIANSNTITNNGTFDISAASSSVTVKNLTGTGTTVLGQNTLTITNASGTLSGAISSPFSTSGFTIAGGALTLGAANNFSGTTTINAGATINLGFSGSLANSIIVNNGTYDISASKFGDVPMGLSGSGVVLLGTKTLTVWDSVYKAVRTFSGTISGSGNFVITDATQIFTGTNTYTGGTIVSGILQIGDGGTSGSVVGNITNNALVVFNRSDTVISANVISGSGALTQLGPGSLIFISDNSYTGGTKISGGALQLGNGGTTGTISGDVVDNSALVFNRSNTISFGGAISGTGSVTQAGSGTLILTGSNSYTGGTTISSGTLAVGNGAIAGSITGDVINNGTLMFNRPDSIGFGGVISGTGSVIKTGAGSLTLTGANTYTGTTTIANGTLVIGHAGSGSVAGSITNNAALIFNRSDAVSFANVISGSGTLTKMGGSSLTLSGINTYTGATTVSAGTLNVTGNIAPSAVTVQSGATLGGTGTVGSTIVASGGTLAPGNSIGTLTVSGNLTLASGANYSVEVSPTAADRTMVSGTAGLNGNFIANLSSGTYSIGQRYTVVTAPGGVSGTFASLVMSGPPTYVKGQLSYDANNAYLTLSPNALAPSLSNATGNQGKVVAAIDTSVAAGNIPAGGFVALYGLTGSALNSALDQISGQVGPNTINAVGQGSLSFLTMTAQGGSGTDNFAPGSAYGGADAPHRAQLGAGETRVWASAYGGHVGLSADAASGAASLSSSNVGLIGGADMAWDDGLLAGVTVGLGRQKFSSGNGTGYSDDIMIGVYARKDFGPLYVTAAFGYGSHYIETLRVITVSGTDVLQGKQNADDYGGRVEAGWRTALDEQYMLSPYFAVAAASFETPAYSETALSGASTFALSFAAHSSTLGRTELGSGLSRDYETENGVMTADLRAAWAHQLDDQPFTQASFQTLPGASFLVTGVRPASDTALLGASIQVQNRSGLFFGLKGETQLAAGTTILQGAGHLGWRW